MLAIYLCIIAVPIILIFVLIKGLTRNARRRREYERNTPPGDYLPVRGAYQSKWMFTFNEKGAYYKLKQIADELGYIVFAKVRLLDLIEPVKGIPRYKTYFYKIQAKHVDFVLCDPKLVARYIIELDDSSHFAPDRQYRDWFVDEAVKGAGYEIIHTFAIDDSLKQQIKPLHETERL